MSADLHLHTLFSDGTYTPEELATAGRRHGLETLALTDHDTVEGCARMQRACAAEQLDFVPGLELTSEVDGQELHVLGYHIDTAHAGLLRAVARFQTVRTQRIHEMVERLNGLQIPLKAEDVFAIANCRSPGRPHVGRALVQAGYCRTVDEAFDRFLRRNRPAWVPKLKMSAADAIRLIHEAGGVAVLAHPGLTNADELIPDLVRWRLDGLECFHSRHSASLSDFYVHLAERFDLLVTGGSDCHGMSKGRPLIGTVRLPAERVERLREAAHRRRERQSSAVAAG